MNINKIHFVGIKGVGMAPLAIIAKEAGMSVSGSDVSSIYITDEVLIKAGITIHEGFNKNNIDNIDLVITTGAHGGYENEEVITAKEKGIPVMTQGEAVGYFMSGKPFERSDMEGISIAGCHGKTTTTAMIATVLKSAKKDPSFVIGTGIIPSLGSSGYYGKGKFFVAEADEYATEPKYDKTPKFLWQHPSILVVTNIEYDHPDLYPTFDSLVNAYKKLISQAISEKGIVVGCGDDVHLQKIIKNTCLPAGRTNLNIITYGFNSSNDYVLSNVEAVVGGTQFDVSQKRKKLGTFIIPVLGEHNCLNALATIVVGLQAGLNIEEIEKGLEEFKGTKRRLEFVGNTKNGAAIFDDYAHHPTEIQKTLSSLRDRYKDLNIICVFQPHTFSRTKLLFDEFCDSFSSVDLVILTDIFASAREDFDKSISSKDLVEKISQKQPAIYLSNLSDVVQYFEEKEFGSDTILVTMGAGDVYQIAYKLKK